MITRLFLIFLAGLLVDLLVTKHTKYVVGNRTGLAALYSGLITIANFALLTFIVKEGLESGIFNLLAYAGGKSLGTFLGMKKIAR